MVRLGVLKKPAVLVPVEYADELFSLSKAALVDLVWDLCAAQDEQNAIRIFRDAWATVKVHRGDR